MKFSIVIPTQDRPELLALAVRHAQRLEHPDFEIIVSDNSTSDAFRARNLQAVGASDVSAPVRVVHPSRVLSPPEHFEFALDFASGDYVAYVTDKMVLLPNVLADAEAAIHDCGADIVNWAHAAYRIDDRGHPAGAGRLFIEYEFLARAPRRYDPMAALRSKAGCFVPRNRQSTREYATGKIVFGCFSMPLLRRIRARTGTVFGGATHDYSALVQGLSLAGSAVMLGGYGIVFIALPPDQSLGSITATEPRLALRYYQSFSDPERVLSSLMVPGLYASQHNMVAHDFQKFLPLYGHQALFNKVNWLAAICDDLADPAKIWADAGEKAAQLALFHRHVGDRRLRALLKGKAIRKRVDVLAERVSRSVMHRVNSRMLRREERPSGEQFVAPCVEEAIARIPAVASRLSSVEMAGRVSA
jgi:hypothetical protein